MSEDLIKVRMSGSSIQQLALARSINSDLGNIVERIGTEVLQRAGELALSASRSVVPVDTGILREDDIQLENANSFNGIATVKILDAPHFPKGLHNSARSTGTEPGMDSVALAKLLNLGVSAKGYQYKRSQTSKSEGGFSSIGRGSPTQGWIDGPTGAIEQFAAALQRMLASA